jgi:hypothetical protein
LTLDAEAPPALPSRRPLCAPLPCCPATTLLLPCCLLLVARCSLPICRSYPRLGPRQTKLARAAWTRASCISSSFRVRFLTRRRRQAIKRPPTLQIAPAALSEATRKLLTCSNGSSFTPRPPHSLQSDSIAYRVSKTPLFASPSPEAAPFLRRAGSERLSKVNQTTHVISPPWLLLRPNLSSAS